VLTLSRKAADECKPLTCGATSFDIDKMEVWHLIAPPVPPPLAAQGPHGVFADEQRDVVGWCRSSPGSPRLVSPL
jgi:hypothetical protein